MGRVIELEISTLVVPVLSAVLSAIAGVCGVYVAVSKQLAAGAESQRAMMADITEIKSGLADVRDELRTHGEKLAGLSEKTDGLAGKVEKHNSVVERTFKLENDAATAWRRHDELAQRVDRLENIKIGGSE